MKGMHKTVLSPRALTINRKKHTLNAAGIPLGRLATQISILLTGKRKINFRPHLDMGDFVNVINAAKLRFTGKKLTRRVFYTHSMHPGGLRAKLLKDKFKNPQHLIADTVWRMLPKNKHQKVRIKRLKVTP